LCAVSVPAAPASYTLSLHDALPIFGVEGGREHEGGGALGPALVLPGLDRDADAASRGQQRGAERGLEPERPVRPRRGALAEHDQDRKSTRLNSSHVKISYAVFCLKK